MKAALLCNGPSRVAFQGRTGYDYVIGCNIPWCRVDATVIMDKELLQTYNSVDKFYVGRKVWADCPNKIKNSLIDRLLGIVETLPDYDSSGHAACRTLLSMGATDIDIYGCDSWFVNNTESYTHQFVDSRSDDMTKHVSVWRQRWYELMGKNPDVKFNFIGDPR